MGHKITIRLGVYILDMCGLVWARWSGAVIVQTPRTRKIGRSVPEIEQKWKLTVHRYIESACEEALGCWSEAGAEEGSLLAVRGPSAYVLTRQKYLLLDDWLMVCIIRATSLDTEAWCEYASS